MTSINTEIHFFNTLSRRKEPFSPIVPKEVHIYTCGPTVYNFAHIGNFRAFVFEDLLKRWLEYQGFRVIHVMNLTDVDDKTIKGAKLEKIPVKQYTEFYANAFFEDIANLNIKPANHYPKATEHIPEMVAIIQTLIDKGYAYKGEDDSIYYAIRKFKNYGKLSKIKIKKLKKGVRVRMDEYTKEEAQDFALWKAWAPEDGDVYWETKLGKGRPGWHIECSAMSMKYLGETFDIHCGGVDNMFPHHENEIAQSEAATGKIFVNYWLHNEHLMVEGKRMAKSLGNFYTLRDLLKKEYNPIAIRYLLLSTHYRQQLNFTFDGLDAAKAAIYRLRNFMRRLLDANGKGSKEKIVQLMNDVLKGFSEAMNDDLNISIALASMFEFVREVNILLDKNLISQKEGREVYALMMDFDKVLGVIGEIRKEEELSEEANNLIRMREEARNTKDWKTADEIRLKLKAMGIIIEDTSQGTRWKKENT